MILGILSGCQSQNQSDGPGYGVLPPALFNEVIQTHKDLILLDVRTPAEFSNGKIEGARNLDVQSPDFVEQLNKLDKNAEYGIYCALGRRSAFAIDKMKSMGFTRLYDLGGGYNAWMSEKDKK